MRKENDGSQSAATLRAFHVLAFAMITVEVVSLTIRDTNDHRQAGPSSPRHHMPERVCNDGPETRP